MPGDQGMSERINALFEKRIADLSDQLATGKIDIGTWQITMREELRSVNALQVVAGAGGDKANVSADDWLKLGSELQKQYRYLQQFARDIQAGVVQPSAITARAQLYARSGQSSFWRQATNGIELPAYPRDGSSPCLSNCGCEWRLVGNDAYWVRGKDDSCEVCIQREREWNPYRGAQ